MPPPPPFGLVEWNLPKWNAPGAAHPLAFEDGRGPSDRLPWERLACFGGSGFGRQKEAGPGSLEWAAPFSGRQVLAVLGIIKPGVGVGGEDE